MADAQMIGLAVAVTGLDFLVVAGVAVWWLVAVLVGGDGGGDW